MSADLIERLRARQSGVMNANPDPLCAEAADELARLRAALATPPTTEPASDEDDEQLTQHIKSVTATAVLVERKRCFEIALAIDSGRGNEKEIAAAIRAAPTASHSIRDGKS